MSFLDRFSPRWLLLLVTLMGYVWPTSAAADDTFSRLSIVPAEITLTGPRSRQQVLVTGQAETQGSPLEADLTRRVTFESTAPAVATVTAAGVVLPHADGEAEIIAKFGQHEARTRIKVAQFAVATPIDFQTDVIAALSQPGCNSGACHGSPQGKNGFRLSLRGFDPALDFATLTRESNSRRTNSLEPDQSLILRKASGGAPHQGGVRMKPHDEAYRLLKTWIAEGCQMTKVERKLVRLEVQPSRRRLSESHPEQQLLALAHFNDGSIRDVTHQVVFTSNDETAAKITSSGLVSFKKTAEATFLVRYLSQIVGSRISYVRRDPEFVFKAPEPINDIDRHVFAKQRALQLLPTEIASDEVFVRRVHLDTIGTLPTAAQAAQFLDSKAPDKRSQLIEELLRRDEFASFWALKWADVMRGSEVTISKRGVHRFHRYLVERFHEDRPFDEFARETLTSLGNTLQHPGANFHRVARTPEDAAEAMSQLFLGVRIGCARCHNHPFEAMTQGDYYGIAAYFARVKFKGQQFGRDDEIVYLDRREEVRHPVTREIVAPIAFGTLPGDIKPDDDRRERLVDWLVQPSNPYFAKSIVNRLWYHVMGRGIVDPVDDFRDTNPPSNDDLLQHLAGQFTQSGFRIKPVLRQILNSATYQLSSKPVSKQSPQAADPTEYFTSATLGMLGAEQVLDAVSSATGIAEEFPGYPVGTRAIELADGAVEHHFLKAFSKPVRDASCECARETDPALGQVIHLLNNPTLVGNIRSEQSRIATWLKAGQSDDEIVELVYLTTLTRRPTPSEQALIRKHLSTAPDRRDGLFDLQFALFNSNEFLLRH